MVLLLCVSLPPLAWAGSYDHFAQLSPEAQVEELGRATPEQRLEMMRAIRTAMDTDPLTGAKNRRALDAAERRGFVAFISFDLDHFKNLNDTFGHPAGDAVLGAVTALARAKVRDPIFRMGGEEFLIVVPNARLEEARLIADRLREAISRLAFEDYPGLRVTASFGIAVGQADSHAIWDAIREASDEALYAAKSSGRNRVTLAPESRPCEIALAGGKTSP